MYGWDQDRRNEFRQNVFSSFSNIKAIRIIDGVCDSHAAYKNGNVKNQEEIYFRTYKIVTERFQYFLQDITKHSGFFHSGIIVADHRSGHQDNKMRKQHERLVRDERMFTSTYNHFIESIFLSPSHMSIGIQLADMIAGAIWRSHEYSDATWLNAIKPVFRTDSNGKIDGFGVARCPKNNWVGPIVA